MSGAPAKETRAKNNNIQIANMKDLLFDFMPRIRIIPFPLINRHISYIAVPPVSLQDRYELHLNTCCLFRAQMCFFLVRMWYADCILVYKSAIHYVCAGCVHSHHDMYQPKRLVCKGRQFSPSWISMTRHFPRIKSCLGTSASHSSSTAVNKVFSDRERKRESDLSKQGTYFPRRFRRHVKLPGWERGRRWEQNAKWRMAW